MLVKTLFAAATLASQAVSASFIRPRPNGAGPVVVDLNCPQCPFAGPGGNGSAWMHDQGLIKLRLELGITDDHQSLQVNGQPIFPLQPRDSRSLTVVQTRTSDGAETAPLRIGYVMETLPGKPRIRGISDTVLEIYILNIQDIPVQTDGVKIGVIQSRSQTIIGGAFTTPYSESPGADHCTTNRCRLRALVANHLRNVLAAARAHAKTAKTWAKSCCCCMKRIAGCAQGVPRKFRKWFNNCCASVRVIFTGDGPRRSHGHRYHGFFSRLVQQTVRYLLLPAFFGVMGGLFACSVGMLLGRGLAAVMNRRSACQTRGCGVPAASPRNVEDAIVEDEKDGLLVSLPPYTDTVVAEKQ